MDLDVETQWAVNNNDLSYQFAKRYHQFCDENPSNHVAPLEYLVNVVMTELWDFMFSQTEILNVFLPAIDDMLRYTSGEERRS